MLYNLLKPLVRLSVQAYFKKITVHGKQYLDMDRVVFVSNHPSALMDPIVAAVSSDKPMHFIAGAEWFGKGLKHWIFRNQFNMIPVHRPWLGKGDKAPSTNEDMFLECYKSLERDERILIYPEASSITVPWIRELKTGAARIKSGADAYINDGREVSIVPIGLSYANPHRFQTSVLVNVGPPVDFSGIEPGDFDDPKDYARAMTDRVKAAMEDLVLHLEDEVYFPVTKGAIKLLTDVLLKELGKSVTDQISAFQVKKRIITRIEFIRKNQPELILPLEERIQDYIARFEELGFRRFNPFETSAGVKVMLIGGVVLCAPLFLAGLLFNGLPFLLVQWGFDRLLREKVTGEHKEGELNPAFAGSLAFALGLVAYLIWYIGIAVLASQWIPWYIAWPASWIAGYWLGRFSLTYSRWWKRLMRIRKWNILQSSQPQMAQRMLSERRALISELLDLYENESV